MAQAPLVRVQVHPDGGESFVVDVTTRDGLRWERARKGRSIKRFDDNPTFEDLYSLTFVAVLRDGRFDGDINQFEERCDLERIAIDDDEAGPTPPDR